eukprot:2228492-Amphidinium_carterae.1
MFQYILSETKGHYVVDVMMIYFVVGLFRPVRFGKPTLSSRLASSAESLIKTSKSRSQSYG